MSVDLMTTKPPRHGFAGLPVCTRLNDLEADIAIVGLHYVSPYPQKLPPAGGAGEIETAPGAIRRQSRGFADYWGHYSFDFNDVLLGDRPVRMVDCGDVGRQPEQITSAIDTILKKGAVPIALGTDEGGTIAVMRAYGGHSDLCVVHVDAHIDWRDERYGERNGYCSVMRRTSEMPWVKTIAHVGLRGVGSARRQEVDDALSFGDIFISARECHRHGADACVERIPAAPHYLITIDADALDPAIAPGVLFPSPGGLSFDEVTDLVEGIARRGPIAGILLFEVRPELDVNGLTAKTAVQMILNFIGILARRCCPTTEIRRKND